MDLEIAATEKKIIDQWIAKSMHKSIALVIGAGFSKNALIKGTGDSAAPIIPIWKDVVEILSDNMKAPRSDNFDDLFIVDIFRDFFGDEVYERILCESLPDDEIEPGRAHLELAKIPLVSSIITTNNLDTLLDRAFTKAHKIIREGDISGSMDSVMDIIYIHGHRSRPDTWIFSRTDFDEIEINYPIKISIVRNILAKYPSLFIGFGHTDPNLHSITRYVNRNVGPYMPPMLSLSVFEPNQALLNHWNKLGLSIATIGNISETIEESVANAIKYISIKRAETLSDLKKIIPGHRIGESSMENLVSATLDCRCRDGKYYLCEYHSSRANSKMCRLKEDSGIVSTGPFTSLIMENSATVELLKEMRGGFSPAGGWGLMPSHRSWLIKHFSASIKELNDSIKIFISGIAGQHHLVDTISILLGCIDESKKDINVEIDIIDKCCGPIYIINNIMNNNGYDFSMNDEVDIQYHHLYEDIVRRIMNGRLSINAKSFDLLSKNINVNKKFNVVTSHHLISMWGFDEIHKTKRYINNMSNILEEGGIMISALNMSMDNYSILQFHDIMQGDRLYPLEAEMTFDIYDVDLKNSIIDTGHIPVRKETLLAAHKKGSQA